MADIVERLRNFCIWNNRHSHYEPVPVTREAADEIESLRLALGRANEWKRLQAEDIATLGAEVGRLEFNARVQAKLLADIERETIERCAKLVEPKRPRPCDCEPRGCYCHNQGDEADVTAWDADAYNAKAIRSLSPARDMGEYV